MVSLYALDLNNYRVFYNDINSVLSDGLTLVRKRERHLAEKVQTLKFKFYAKSLFVSLFQQPRTKMPVHLNGTPDNPFC